MNFKNLFVAASLSLASLNLNNADAQIIVNTSQIQPAPFEQGMAVLRAGREFYYECLEKLENLLDKTAKIKPYISKDKDPRTWSRYSDYYNSVVNEYNRLKEQGTDTGTRRRIHSLKMNYSEVISPIVSAYNRRNDLAREQYSRIQYSKESCSRFFSEISLDEFLDGNTPSVTYRR